MLSIFQCQQSPEVIVDEFSEVEGLELDITSNEVKILRTNRGPEMVMFYSCIVVSSILFVCN